MLYIYIVSRNEVNIHTFFPFGVVRFLRSAPANYPISSTPPSDLYNFLSAKWQQYTWHGLILLLKQTNLWPKWWKTEKILKDLGFCSEKLFKAENIRKWLLGFVSSEMKSSLPLTRRTIHLFNEVSTELKNSIELVYTIHCSQAS